MDTVTPPADWSLEAFERCLDLERPPIFGAGHATQRLRHVRDQLGRRGWEALTPTAKGKWTKLLSYNRLDVEHLETLVIRAARDLADAQTPTTSYIEKCAKRTPAICDDCSWVTNLLNRPGGPVR